MEVVVKLTAPNFPKVPFSKILGGCINLPSYSAKQISRLGSMQVKQNSKEKKKKQLFMDLRT